MNTLPKFLEMPLIRYRGFEVSVLGPTNYRGYRLKIKDLKRSKSILLSRSEDEPSKQALKYLRSIGIEIVAETIVENGPTTLLSTNFDTALRKN